MHNNEKVDNPVDSHARSRDPGATGMRDAIRNDESSGAILAYPQVTRGMSGVELRGFEPLTFSNGQAVGISRILSVNLGPTRRILNPATDLVI